MVRTTHQVTALKCGAALVTLQVVHQTPESPVNVPRIESLVELERSDVGIDIPRGVSLVVVHYFAMYIDRQTGVIRG